jgi:8-oxo-dGTP diphosphatase
VCLPIKASGIGAGKRNGYGGSVEKAESFREAAAREIAEEARVKVWPNELKQIAYLICNTLTEDNALRTYEVAVFVACTWLGEIRKTEEMGEPEWFPLDKLPVEELLPDNKDWLPIVLKGKVQKRNLKILTVHIWYGPKQVCLRKPTHLIWSKPPEE